MEDKDKAIAVVATIILERTWDWGDTAAVYLPRKLHDEAQRITAKLAELEPDQRRGPVDPGNLQHFVALAVSWHIAVTTLKLLAKHPVEMVLSALGRVVGKIVKREDVDLECDTCHFAEECKAASKGGECCLGDETETSPLN
jgi:hypothetical protein